jgi:hypothetical protein
MTMVGLVHSRTPPKLKIANSKAPSKRIDIMTARQCMVGAAEINDVRIDQLLPFQGSRT